MPVRKEKQDQPVDKTNTVSFEGALKSLPNAPVSKLEESPYKEDKIVTGKGGKPVKDNNES